MQIVALVLLALLFWLLLGLVTTLMVRVKQRAQSMPPTPVFTLPLAGDAFQKYPHHFPRRGAARATNFWGIGNHPNMGVLARSNPPFAGTTWRLAAQNTPVTGESRRGVTGVSGRAGQSSGWKAQEGACRIYAANSGT